MQSSKAGLTERKGVESRRAILPIRLPSWDSPDSLPPVSFVKAHGGSDHPGMILFISVVEHMAFLSSLSLLEFPWLEQPHSTVRSRLGRLGRHIALRWRSRWIVASRATFAI